MVRKSQQRRKPRNEDSRAVKRLEKKLANVRLSPVERKFVLVNSNFATLSVLGAVAQASTIVQGTSQNQRIGDSVRLLNFTLRANVNWASGLQQVRFILFI